ncbi:MAG: DNA-processing protein DprA [Pseudomonadota bacterium]|nr:DNA-processing protein DprA [Pseudomonadota bacterium]
MSPTSSAIPDPSAADHSHPAAGALLELSLVPGLRGSSVATLLSSFGGAPALIAQPWRRLAEALDGALAGRLRAGPAAVSAALAAAQAWAAQPGHRLLTLLDADYPARLAELPDPPLVLWLKGRASLLHDPGVGVVGSRRASPQGMLDAGAFARYLGKAGVTVISGLAEGIDGAAHRAALDTPGATLAVLAHGLDRIYPPVHRELAHQIAGQGLLVSEYPLGTPALRHHFPERNRLISGLSLGVLVVEAAHGSGSLLTARSALEQGREVMALPGSIHSALSKGCHQLIREGASLVESAAEVLALVLPRQLPPATAELPERPAQTVETADKDTRDVLSALASGPASVDRLVAAIGLTASQVSTILGREELTGTVVRLSDGCYQRLIPGAAPAAAPARDS